MVVSSSIKARWAVRPVAALARLVGLAGLAVLAGAMVLGATGCSGDDPAEGGDTETAAEAVAFNFSYETTEGGNTTNSVMVDGVDVTYGNIAFAGSGTLGGEPVEVALQAHALFRDGTGPSGGYFTVTNPAGDVLVLDMDSQATRTGQGATIEGVVTVVAGTGRYASVTGGGTGTGVRDAALGAGVRWEMQLDVQGW